MDSPEMEIQSQQEMSEEEKQAIIAARYGLAKWIFRRTQGIVKGRVLEIEKGFGHIAKYCKQEGAAVEVQDLNLTDPSFGLRYKDLLNAFDLLYLLQGRREVICDKEVVANCAALLKPGGFITVVYPCHTALYEGILQGVDDWKFLNRKYIRSRIGACFKLEKARFFEMKDHTPAFVSVKNEYEENLRVFKKTSINHFVPLGLFALVIGKKRLLSGANVD